MNIYLAGWQSGTLKREKRLLKAGVFKHRCFSFANVIDIPGLPWHLPGVEAGYDLCLASGIGIMMDSGVYSLRTYRAYLERKGKSTASMPDAAGFLKLYAEFFRKNHKKWDFGVTVDFTKEAKLNFNLHAKLEKLGIRPTPVFHGDDSLDYLRRYADKGYSLVCIGNLSGAGRRNHSQTRRYLDAVYALGERLSMGFHGLGMTSPWTMIDYPWRSVDSSSWARVAGFGSILGWDERTRRLSTLHVSDKQAVGSLLHGNSLALEAVRAHVETEGYDFEMLRTDHIYRHQYNAYVMLRLATFAGMQHSPRWRSLV